MSIPDSDITITAQCLCKAHVFTARIPQSSLPLKASCCHCTSCRHNTGALYSSDTAWPGSAEHVWGSPLSRYQFSHNVDVLFCGTCYSTMFFDEHYAERPKAIGVFTGALANNDLPNLITFTDHIFVPDTVDGGATPWLITNADGTPIPRWVVRSNESDELTEAWPPVAKLPSFESTPSTTTPAVSIQCRCKGVDLVLRPYSTGEFVSGDGNLPWFIDPENLKHYATFDVCDPCRTSFGVDIVHWTFALLAQLDFANQPPKGETKDGKTSFPRSSTELKSALAGPNRDERFGTLAMYQSSPDVQRYSCSRCGASVFYAVDDRPEMINIAIGLLNAPEGARAENLLSWSFGSQVGNIEDVRGGWREGLAEVARKNGEAWRIERGFPKSFRRVIAEKASEKN